jgi:hypothetical protein
MLVNKVARRRGRKEKTKGLKRGEDEEKSTADQQPQDLKEGTEDGGEGDGEVLFHNPKFLHSGVSAMALLFQAILL